MPNLGEGGGFQSKRERLLEGQDTDSPVTESNVCHERGILDVPGVDGSSSSPRSRATAFLSDLFGAGGKSQEESQGGWEGE